MIIRTLSLLTVLAAFGSVSTPVFAADDEIAAPGAQITIPVDPPRCDPRMRDCRPEPRPQPCQPWMRNCNPEPRPQPNYECFARNALGRTFVAYGSWRTPRQYILERALEMCRNQSIPFIRNTCREMGCR